MHLSLHGVKIGNDVERVYNMSNLIKHAENELKLAGLYDKDSCYGGEIAKAIMELIKTFSDQDHSGCSAGMVCSYFKKLASFETLSPLNGNDDEWFEYITDRYQNTRHPAVFKDGKNGRAYYIDAIVWKSQDGRTWSGGDGADGIKSVLYIKSFPFTPKTFIINVTEKEVAKDDCIYHINDIEDVTKVLELYDKKT